MANEKDHLSRSSARVTAWNMEPQSRLLALNCRRIQHLGG